MASDPWPGRYALACGDLALFVGDAYDGDRPQSVYHPRGNPEDQGVVVGDRFLVYRDGGAWRFTLVYRPTVLRVVEAEL